MSPYASWQIQLAWMARPLDAYLDNGGEQIRATFKWKSQTCADLWVEAYLHIWHSRAIFRWMILRHTQSYCYLWGNSSQTPLFLSTVVRLAMRPTACEPCDDIAIDSKLCVVGGHWDAVIVLALIRGPFYIVWMCFNWGPHKVSVIHDGRAPRAVALLVLG